MTDAKTIPQVGEIVAGKYLIKRVLGEGGMGVVLAAEHTRLRQDVAIKFLNPEMLGIEEIVQRFDREARAAATLRSRHVVRVTDVEQTANGIPYMVMELLQGSDLETERERRTRIPYAEAVDYVLQACSALSEAHGAGIVHRDLKPANLFFAQQGEHDVPIVKVLDFGISKFLQEGDTKLTSAGAIMGTALYMSPEQIRGDAMIDARADIWSLGVILYELISGVPPWNGPATRVAAAIVAEKAPPISADVDLPSPLAALIERMMEKDPAARPQTVSEVATELVSFTLPGGVGAEVAEQLTRRQRGGARSSPSLPTTTSPSLARELGHAQTARVTPERSTMTATTSSLPLHRPSRMLGAVVAVGVVGVIAVVAIVFVGRGGRTTAASTAQPAPETSIAPVASTRAIPLPVPAASSAEPVASTETPKHVAPGAHPVAVPPRPTATASLHPSAAPTPAKLPSDATNPVFLK